MDSSISKILLIKSKQGENAYNYPKGKIEHGETPAQCAIREVKEEIGFDISPYLDEKEYIEIETHYGRFQRLYMVTGVDQEESEFTP